MSLKSRVEQSMEKAEHGTGASGFLSLRQSVQDILPSEKLATLVQESPARAKSEVQRACIEAFSDPAWDLVDAAARTILVGEVVDSIFGFGPIEELLEDETITEVMINGPEKVFFERNGQIFPAHQRFASEEQLRALIDRILGPLGRRVDESCPMVNARLPQGHRVNVIMPPLSMIGPVVTIRKFSSHVYTLDDLMAMGSFDEKMKRFLEWAVRLRKNIAVSGGTGSGKTTLLNALSCVIPPNERIITIEDSAELRFMSHPHVVPLEARSENSEGKGEVAIRDLVINALRMRPDRIVVGECRGAEALDMLQAMSTGHDGSLTTLHANSPDEVMSRLTTMVRYGADLPVDVVEANIANAIDLIVQTARSPRGTRYISDVAELFYIPSYRKCNCRKIYWKGIDDAEGTWLAQPSLIGAAESQGLADKDEIDRWWLP